MKYGGNEQNIFLFLSFLLHCGIWRKLERKKFIRIFMMLKYCHLSSVCKVLEQVIQIFIIIILHSMQKPRKHTSTLMTKEYVERESFGKFSFIKYWISSVSVWSVYGYQITNFVNCETPPPPQKKKIKSGTECGVSFFYPDL